MNRADVEAAWQGVNSPSTVGDLAGRAAPELDAAVGALLAVDHSGLRHLLIAAEVESVLPKRPTIRGMEVALDELRVGDRPARRYFDVACKDKTMHGNFTAVVTEILEALQSDSMDVARTLDAIFDRWRWFWGVAPDVLTGEEAVGLFGELWFLEFWLEPIDAVVLNAWTGPTGDRHDFKWAAASIEIKATRARSDGAAKHRVSRLDQLEDPDRGQLYLFSLRATPDPIGKHSLTASVERIRDTLSDEPQLLHAFDERLGLLGYNPAHRQHYDTALRVVAEELYRVEDDFPRLTQDSFPSGVPNGVDDIAYTLDLVACAKWRIATAPGPESRELRATLS